MGSTPSREYVCFDSDRGVNVSYRAENKIAEGPLCEVFEVIEHNDSFRRQLVVKVVRPELVQNLAFQQRLKDALKALRRNEKSDPPPPPPLPYSEQLVDGQIGERDAFLICDRLEGEPLSTLYQRQGRLSIADVRQITNQVAEALAAAHARNVVHGNLTPSHIMVARSLNKDRPPTLRVKVRNFCLARPLDRPDLFGTPSYLAPEQISPIDLRPAATKETDLYTLALIVFELLAGRRAFPGDSVESVARKLLREDPPYFEFNATTKREIDRVNQVLQRAMRKSPSARFASVLEFAEALETPPPPRSVIRPASGSVIVVLPPPGFSPLGMSNPAEASSGSVPALPSGDVNSAGGSNVIDKDKDLEVCERNGPRGEVISIASVLSIWSRLHARSRMLAIAASILLCCVGAWRLLRSSPPPPGPVVPKNNDPGPISATNTPPSPPPPHPKKPGTKPPKTRVFKSKMVCQFDRKIGRELEALIKPCVDFLKPRIGFEVKFFPGRGDSLTQVFSDATPDEQARVKSCLGQPQRTISPLFRDLPRAGLPFHCQ